MQPDEWCLRHFDHLSDDLAQDLPETMARLRERCPVTRSDAHGGFWVVSGHEEALKVAQDWGTYSSAHGLAITDLPAGMARNLPVQADPPEALIFKRLVTPYFSPAAIARWEKPTRDLANQLIDGFIAHGECEFMDAFARPLPSRSFFQHAINAPGEDLAEVSRLASKSSTPKDPDARECWTGLRAWVGDFLETRRGQEPRGDVVDAVIAATIDGRPITADEAIGAVQLLILGGLETTAGALGHTLIRLCADPGTQEDLRHHPERISAAVTEFLRLDPSFVSVGRTAVRDAELAGHLVKSGDKVLIHWASANRDAREFGDPDRFDPGRERNRHLTFGAGPHRCIGSHLARMNMRIALEEILRRMDDVKLTEGAEIRYHAGLTRSPVTVPITFAPREAAGS